MATPRTRRLVASQKAARTLSYGISSRQRLLEEKIKLDRAIAQAQARLVEINEEEEILATAINEAGDVIAEAASDVPDVREPA
jgi:hypothetical protein